MADRRIEVFVQTDGVNHLAGELWSHRRRNRESMTFSYAPEYLGHPAAFALDPALPLRDGLQQTPAGQGRGAAVPAVRSGGLRDPRRGRESHFFLATGS